jgi:hypothetical protein
MPIHYRIDSERGVVLAAGEGHITVADLEAYCREIVDDSDYRPGFDELFDFRRAQPWQVPTSDLRKLREVNRQLSGKVGNSRLAYVVGSDFGFGLGRIFMALSDDSKIEHRVFREMTDAREWLGLPRGEADTSPEG